MNVAPVIVVKAESGRIKLIYSNRNDVEKIYAQEMIPNCFVIIRNVVLVYYTSSTFVFLSVKHIKL